MSDEDMVAYLARCQLDPTMPRASIETLLHAFVPAPHVHHTHPGRHQRARRQRGRRAPRARVLRRRGRLDPVHPAGLHALPPGRRGGAGQSRTSSSSCWPSTASWSGATAPRRRTGARSRSSTRRSPSSTSAPARRPASAAAHPARQGRGRCARELLRELLPGDPRRRLERARQAADARHVRALGRVRLLRRRGAARHRRRALPRPSRAHQAPAAVDPLRPRRRRRRHAARTHRRARGGVPRRLPRVHRGARRRDDRARPTPTRGSC